MPRPCRYSRPAATSARIVRTSACAQTWLVPCSHFAHHATCHAFQHTHVPHVTTHTCRNSLTRLNSPGSCSPCARGEQLCLAKRHARTHSHAGGGPDRHGEHARTQPPHRRPLRSPTRDTAPVTGSCSACERSAAPRLMLHSSCASEQASQRGRDGVGRRGGQA
jgi:hypothetical protein